MEKESRVPPACTDTGAGIASLMGDTGLVESITCEKFHDAVLSLCASGLAIFQSRHRWQTLAVVS